MFYKIVELSTDKRSGHTYVLVHFWERQALYREGKPPTRINDFLMQLRPTGVRAVANASGGLKSKGGPFIDPSTLGFDRLVPEWEKETYNRDLPAEIMSNIEAYWARAKMKDYPANHSNARIQRDNRDPHGVLARPDVMELRDKEVDRP